MKGLKREERKSSMTKDEVSKQILTWEKTTNSNTPALNFSILYFSQAAAAAVMGNHSPHSLL